MNDQATTATLHAALELAVRLRDETGDDITDAARAVLDTVDGDPIAALCVVAALVRVDQPVDRWWTRPLPALNDVPLHIVRAPKRRPTTVEAVHRRLAPCGTHAAFNRHRANGQTVDDACLAAEKEYQRERHLRRTRKGTEMARGAA